MSIKENPLVIRKLTTADFNAVVQIYKNAVRALIENNIYQWDELYPDEHILLDDIAKGAMYAALHEGNVVSVFVLNREYPEQYLEGKWRCGDNYIILHRLCVNPRYQRKGVGTRTMLQIEELAKEQGFSALRLDAFSENPFALKIYEKLNFSKTGEVKARKGTFYLFEKALK
jgi:GNAT superfamily N-acetyltransferase